VPIEQEHVDGRYGPIIVCDHCHERIRNKDGNVYWRHDDQHPAALDGPYFLHKRCSVSWEHERTSEEMWLTAELEVWLIWALENAGYNVEKAKGLSDVTSAID
jgi:hypothetical protein